MSSQQTIQICSTVRRAHRCDTRARTESQSASRRSGLRILPDISYTRDGEERHKLDLYLPERSRFPMVVFAHGGSWMSGDKAGHGTLGTFLARHGIGAALVNYRLWPQVQHPGPAQDLARAFAWVRKHIADVGGDADRVFLCGHSAGAHRAALLGTDESLLGAEGLGLEHVEGVIAISGIYRIHWNITLYGAGAVFRNVNRAAASPILNVKPGCPPFLTVYAQKEIWTLGGQARKLHANLLAQRCRSRLIVAKGEDHCSIISNVALPSAEYGKEILRFIHEGQ